MKKFLIFTTTIFLGLLVVVSGQVGYSSNIGTNTGGSASGGSGVGNCIAGKVVTGLNAASAPTCSDALTTNTLTANTPFSFTQVWNNAAVVFAGLNLTYTRTASDDASTFFNVLDGATGNTLFSVKNDPLNTHGGAQLVFNEGGTLSGASENFAFHSRSDALSLGVGGGTGGTRGMFIGNLAVGGNWNIGVVETQLAVNHLSLNADSIVKWSVNSGNIAGTDTGISRLAAASLAVGNGTAGDFTGKVTLTTVQTKTIFTVATLPTCNGAAEGTHASVSDANTPIALANVAGSGAVHISVYCNGSNWIVQ
jgi:hypothetical protein